MNRTTVTKAIEEARRFIECAEALLGDGGVLLPQDVEVLHGGGLSGWGSAAATCRRASMDLTRALAEMRRP